MELGIYRSADKHKQGQSLIEFALILPLIVLLIAGIFDLGRAFFASITITNAAREGARYGTKNSEYYDPVNPEYFYWIKEFTKDESVGSFIDLHSPKAVVSVTCPDIDNNLKCDRFQNITVSISYLYSDSDMILGFFFPGGINMLRSVEMQVP